MVASPYSVRDIINLFNEHQIEGDYDHLKLKIDQLIDKLTAFVKSKGIESPTEDLGKELLSIRLELFKEPGFLQFYKNDLEMIVDERIEEQYKSQPSFIDLENTFVLSLDLYKKITTSILKEETFFEGFASETIPSQKEFENQIQLLSEYNQVIINHYTQSSITLEFGWIISDMVLSKEISISKRERVELSSMLKDNTELFAACCYLLNFWKPDDSDETQWVRNTKILISHLTSTTNSIRINEISEEGFRNILSDT